MAYLRGGASLISPNYPQGVRSIARETMILNAIGAEKEVELGLKTIQLDASFVSHMAPKSAMRIYTSLHDTLRRLGQMAEHNYITKYVSKAKGSVDTMVKLFYALKKAGILKDYDPTTAPNARST